MELVALDRFRAEALRAVLDEEAASWRSYLFRDFSRVAARVSVRLDGGVLRGLALVAAGRVVGYSWYTVAGDAAIVGDLYVLEMFRLGASEQRLAGAMLEALVPLYERVEWRPVLPHAIDVTSLPAHDRLAVHPQQFMVTDAASAKSLPPAEGSGGFTFEPWSDRHLEPAAALIAESFRGHPDCAVNPLLGHPVGARHLLESLVFEQENGRFLPAVSFLAGDRASGSLCGVVILTRTTDASANGDLLAVARAFRHTGVGYELVRRAVCTLASLGYTKVSLTVSAANGKATRIYEKTGFAARFPLAAYTWEMRPAEPR